MWPSAFVALTYGAKKVHSGFAILTFIVKVPGIVFYPKAWICRDILLWYTFV